jgi:GNAT superfamily N-acetyltransferase
MSDKYSIETMSADDVKTAIDWAGREGWNPGLSDAETFYAADNRGFFKGVLNGEIIATGSAVIYDDDYAFCGLYIVDSEYRGKGYGLALTKARLAYCGDRNIGIDGVLENVKIYERIGYVPYYENSRYEGRASSIQAISDKVTALKDVPFDMLRAFDRECFPAHRDAFLNVWINQPGTLALAYMKDGEFKGYGVRRPCLSGHKIGPLFADDVTVADHLLAALTAGVNGEAYYFDIAENNPEAMELTRKWGMSKVFATARMYQKGLPDLAYNKIFGITTFELG